MAPHHHMDCSVRSGFEILQGLLRNPRTSDYLAYDDRNQRFNPREHIFRNSLAQQSMSCCCLNKFQITQITEAMATFFFFAALAASTALVLHALYIRLLPKPIPGIPHHEDSAKSILGDAAYFIELERTGQYWTKFFFNLVSTCKSPIAQYFPGPFSRSHVVIADYREAQDLMSKRSRELGRGYTNNETWKGVVPDHFIAMETFHPSFKDTKFLTKDLMAPTFLHGVREYQLPTLHIETFLTRSRYLLLHLSEPFQISSGSGN